MNLVLLVLMLMLLFCLSLVRYILRRREAAMKKREANRLRLAAEKEAEEARIRVIKEQTLMAGQAHIWGGKYGCKHQWKFVYHELYNIDYNCETYEFACRWCLASCFIHPKKFWGSQVYINRVRLNRASKAIAQAGATISKNMEKLKPPRATINNHTCKYCPDCGQCTTMHRLDCKRTQDRLASSDN